MNKDIIIRDNSQWYDSSSIVNLSCQRRAEHRCRTVTADSSRHQYVVDPLLFLQFPIVKGNITGTKLPHVMGIREAF